MATYTLRVNGQSRSVDVDPDTALLWVLRDQLGLLGTKYACGIAQCGTCTVHLNGTPMRSCTMPISTVGNAEVTTIEGLSEKVDHPVQRAWREHDVVQCGYCQAGQIMTAAAFLRDNPNPTEEQIAAAMHGVLCRCGTYTRIIAAVKTAAGMMG